MIPKFKNIYSELIAIPTISSINDPQLDCSNLPLIEKLAGWLDELGFDIDILPIDGHPHKYNLLATYGRDKNEGIGGILLSGHTDTVPFDQGRWDIDPFKLVEKDNRFYGLGCVDMKGFFAFVIEALKSIDLSQLKKPLYILATADEETTMLGARSFVQNRTIRPDCAIIGEPTSLKPIRAHKGHIAQSITVIGRSGHASDPAKGINAIELMHQVTGHLLALQESLKQKYHNPLFAIPYPTMNLGSIQGGDAVNRICACCELRYELRPLPDLSLEDLNELVRDKLQPLIAQWGDLIQIKNLHLGIPGYECHHQSAVQLIENLLEEKCQAVNYCTEAPFIQQLCPTIVLGPGSIEQAHQPNEYLSTAFIQPTITLLQQLIFTFCHTSSNIE